MLADVGLDLSSMGAFDVYPKKLPDLFKGGQLVVLGRYRQPGDVKATLTGTVDGAAKKIDYGTTTPTAEHKEKDFIPRLWAIRKVGYLLEEIRLRGQKPELRDEVVQLGKKFGIVTPYTSYLVVEDWPIAGPLPAGEPDWRRDRGLPRAAAAPAFAPTAAGGDDLEKSFAAADALGRVEGKAGIEVSRKTRAMKEEVAAPRPSEPVRVAGGRTYLWRAGAWVDCQTLEAPGRSLKVKYLSAAYFALARERPEFRAGLALGDWVVLAVGSGKAVVVGPEEGEEDAAKAVAFLRS